MGRIDICLEKKTEIWFCDNSFAYRTKMKTIINIYLECKRNRENIDHISILITFAWNTVTLITPGILNTCLVKQIIQTAIASSDLWHNYINATLFEWNVTYVSLRLVDPFDILFIIYIFVPISINISNSITYTLVSIHISFLYNFFCLSVIYYGHERIMQF